jgi:hypothetical protein
MHDDVIPPCLDYAAIPDEYEGKWVLLLVDPLCGRQEVVGSGDTLREATRGQTFGDGYIVTRVPRRYTVIVVGDSGSH